MTKLRLLLRELRHANELSQEELARELSVSRQSIISLERGEYLPSTPVLLAMMDFFDCSIEDLFSGYDFKVRQISDDGHSSVHSIQLTPKNTLKNLGYLREEMSDMVERTLINNGANLQIGAVNVRETESAYEVIFQTPGYSEEEIEIEVSNNTLTVSGHKDPVDEDHIHKEWFDQDFSRRIKFIDPIDEDNTEAKIENGILTIITPKITPPEPKTKKITVKKR